LIQTDIPSLTSCSAGRPFPEWRLTESPLEPPFIFYVVIIRVVGKYPSLIHAGIGAFCSGGNSLFNAFFPSLGNHDYTDGAGLNEYLDYFTLPGSGVATSGTSGSERYYDYLRWPVHFFVIDSQGALNSAFDKTAQKNWLQAQLAASGAPWKVVYFHHAPYSSALRGSTAAMQWPYGA
jgi:hypothetical protein